METNQITPIASCYRYILVDQKRAMINKWKHISILLYLYLYHYNHISISITLKKMFNKK